MINQTNNVPTTNVQQNDFGVAAAINTQSILGQSDGVEQCSCTWSSSLNKMIPGCSSCKA